MGCRSDDVEGSGVRDDIGGGVERGGVVDVPAGREQGRHCEDRERAPHGTVLRRPGDLLLARAPRARRRGFRRGGAGRGFRGDRVVQRGARRARHVTPAKGTPRRRGRSRRTDRRRASGAPPARGAAAAGHGDTPVACASTSIRGARSRARPTRSPRRGPPARAPARSARPMVAVGPPTGNDREEWSASFRDTRARLRDRHRTVLGLRVAAYGGCLTYGSSSRIRTR